MENDQLRFLSTILSIVITPNSQFTEIILGDIYQTLDSISSENELNINKLLQLIDLFYERPENSDEKKQILYQIRQRVKQKISNTNQDPSEFLNDMVNKNQKGVGVSILQNDGSFILTDHLTRKILEIKTVSEIQKRLFEYCAIAGQTNLLKQFNEENNLLQQHEVEKEFQMTIYSEKTRKKAMKHLNQASKKAKETLEHMDLRNQEVRVPRSNIQSEKFDYWEKLKIKYLKTITVKITKMNMSINEDFLDSIKNSSQLYGSNNLQCMAKNPTQQYNVVKCEISVNPYVEELLKDDIQKDERLVIYEGKWKAKCEEISTEFKKIKKLKEQAKIENQFQSLYNISSELLQDLNSQIQYQWM